MRSAVFAVFVVLASAMAGVAQAGLLARSARAGNSPMFAVARLCIVAGILFVAARTGHLLLGTLGWIAGLGAASLLLYRKFPYRSLP